MNRENVGANLALEASGAISPSSKCETAKRGASLGLNPYFSARPFNDRHPYKVSLTTVKPAPRLHNKPPAVKRESVYETSWHRFMRLYLYTRDAEEPAKVE